MARLSRLLSFIRKNGADLYHVATPVILSTMIGFSSLSGAGVFLLTWAVMRQITRVGANV